MTRIDSKVSAFLHYCLSVFGLLAYVIVLLFIMWVCFFTESAYNIIEEPEGLNYMVNNPSEYFFALVLMAAIFFPYFRTLLRAKKILFDEQNKRLVIGDNQYNLNQLLIYKEFVYFNLCFSILYIKGSKKKYFFITRGCYSGFPFNTREHTAKKIISLIDSGLSYE